MSGTTNIASQPPGIWAGQWLHLACLLVLLVPVGIAWDYLGRPFPLAFWVAVAIPIVHQVFVWICWRLELRSAAVSERIGFRAYLVVFFVLLVGRVIALLALAWLDAGSLGIPLFPRAALVGVLSVIWVYAAHSIKRDFGFVRAAGADHFDPAYRDMPLVKEGIFRFTSNGMYIFGFFILWIIAVGFDSTAALVVAAFNHAYIWVHFYATEKPDMTYLYASTRSIP